VNKLSDTEKRSVRFLKTMKDLEKLKNMRGFWLIFLFGNILCLTGIFYVVVSLMFKGYFIASGFFCVIGLFGLYIAFFLKY